ncbi:MAG: alpha/beta hydrolase family protein [Bacteroidota bacterium]
MSNFSQMGKSLGFTSYSTWLLNLSLLWQFILSLGVIFTAINMPKQPTSYFIVVLLLFSSTLWAQEEDLQLLNYYQYYQDDANALYKQMVDEAEEQWQAREHNVAALRTASDWQQYQDSFKKKLTQLIGPFPKKTPLNPTITGTIEREDFTVEKVVYQSQPEFYVTAALFIPKNLKGKAPAILYCSGHTAEGFRSPTYQNKIINLVKKGFVVLAFDPLGQGERMQYPDESGSKSQIGGPTHEHSYVGAQAFIAGSSLAKFMIWDGIRSVDYLLSRPEVDPERIGITGRSGGGTQSTYIAAFDDRIYAAAPEAYITRLDILLKTRGPQDAEQNILYFADQQLDLADFLIARAPKPTLIISTTRDFFSIEGARETYREVQRAYQALGEPDYLGMSEDDSVHASTPKNREAMYAFFQQHLHNPGDSDDEEVELFSPEELWVTASGQVATSLNSRNVFDLNREEAIRHAEAIQQYRTAFNAEKTIRNANALSGFRPPSPPKEVHFAGQYRREGYTVQKYLMVNQTHVNPFLLFVPDEPTGNEVVAYFHPEGKIIQTDPGQEIEELVQQGMTVLTADVRGTGELGPGYLRGDAYIDDISYNQWFGGVLTNQSIVARQAADMVSMVDYLIATADGSEPTVTAVAHRTLAPALLHAAAFIPAIDRTILIEPLVSYQALVTNEMYDARWIYSSVAGSTPAYDLADLGASLAPRPLLIVNPLDHQFNPVSSEGFDQEWGWVQNRYESTDNFKVVFSDIGTEIKPALWIEQLE